jgi:very-short-patch-repair endonuclease
MQRLRGGVAYVAATFSPAVRERGMDISLSRRRELRSHATRAEQILWGLLRRRQLLGLKFRRQHPLGPYIVDFFCAASGLVVELDGGQHFSDEGRRKDETRTAFLNRLGVRVMRFSNRELFEEGEAVLESIRRACRR